MPMDASLGDNPFEPGGEPTPPVPSAKPHALRPHRVVQRQVLLFVRGYESTVLASLVLVASGMVLPLSQLGAMLDGDSAAVPGGVVLAVTVVHFLAELSLIQGMVRTFREGRAGLCLPNTPQVLWSAGYAFVLRLFAGVAAVVVMSALVLTGILLDQSDPSGSAFDVVLVGLFAFFGVVGGAILALWGRLAWARALVLDDVAGGDGLRLAWRLGQGLTLRLLLAVVGSGVVFTVLSAATCGVALLGARVWLATLEAALYEGVLEVRGLERAEDLDGERART